ncbi:hypothetical protein BN439_0660 [Erwinia amylovora Ea644]|uniref:Uncharacterized protein n=2 Tax=Erwinia amylovora TaxID=552 RepID=A0A830ZXY8_ERWAM|nr:hypothetical protein EaACW_0458 [Erwinia amylovora ACW56400]QJQ55824.1 hypothetical protein EHX00_3125 [Erwinia amylovora]CBA19402.1 hypothetical protein predicted by Glimmer/Critica [Erwinia amylovora CFBP1430]CCO77302.1 hypothetical protein BN432_0470 [Erwinia amylovora Ea356]CCO81086.1 hypothetical protein BN433_0480 [Erwinia amylovora Ea266]CCO84891.1 hypothetical protein BN434_0469 [Erwinia amylovora CFBP 2585]CCO88677.1 hypothetical protein BN435_0470 [Erwinia amylovora 01SFR-BO]CCO
MAGLKTAGESPDNFYYCDTAPDNDEKIATHTLQNLTYK